MAYTRKTWRQKLHNGHPDKLERVDRKMSDVQAGSLMYIATPEIVDAYIRNIPEGVHTSLQQMRKDLAAAHHADFYCPITSGIFLRIVAEAAYEDYQAGMPLEQITPFWRMIDARAPVAKKLTFGQQFVAEQREKEGLPW